MGITSEITMDWHAALAALAWQYDLGVEDTVGDAPLNRYDLPEAVRPAPDLTLRTPALGGGVAGQSASGPRVPPALPTMPPEQAAVDFVAIAREVAGRAGDLNALRQALAGFDHCDLKRGARNLVFSDGNPAARVLILGEAPGRDEDMEGRPFVGEAGLLLDRMFAAIGLSRHSPDAQSALYVTAVLPWRPPGNRDPSPEEIAMMLPFVERHVALADPDVIVAMGGTPLSALTGEKGILRARGNWAAAFGKPLLPMMHPAYLLRNPIAKREAWADLLALQARLRS